jgi:hypothetical protein
MSVNRAFLAKAINKAQHLALGDPFCDALHSFIGKGSTIAWDDSRALFWVEHPFDGWQVAVWMMPAANAFEPIGGEI